MVRCVVSWHRPHLTRLHIDHVASFRIGGGLETWVVRQSKAGMIHVNCIAHSWGDLTQIPPRHMFICQSLGTAIGAMVNYTFIKSVSRTPPFNLLIGTDSVTIEQVINSKRDFLDGTTIDPTGQWDGRAPSIFFVCFVLYRSALRLSDLCRLTCSPRL